MTLLIATKNPGKVQELRSILAPIAIQTPADVGLDLEIEESGHSFRENAALKAMAYAEATDLIVLADDSGLLVDALHGDPGVSSARYGGEGLDDRGRFELLLYNLRQVTELTHRTARFVCSMVARSPSGKECESTGVCEGLVALKPCGSGGFGYDPVFYLPAYQKTMAEIPFTEKNRISHRAQAAREIARLLPQRFPELS